ncbi:MULTISPECIES: hypothetical protein [Pseudoalteromonas]|uniref:Uncharacterized protein n=1 Tax=Pseudoalteromonas aurantia 208 TaxID=1314867 RepID=A0ABR9E5M6_9GAMM|nr:MULTISPECIES: hypothetical protein [Pseudoalteromonas]MBE0366298.1 hypothetical protein [Pseudoalteromonas aurantia 208]MBQ4846467.1 hypothetical protein [Pseudoalteromonas sp. MMG005]
MVNSLSHLDALTAVVRFTEQQENAYSALIHFAQDKVVYTLTREDLAYVLQRVLSLDIAIDELELWAGLLEIRGDIDHRQIEGALYALANPEQMGSLTLEKVRTLQTLIE